MAARCNLRWGQTLQATEQNQRKVWAPLNLDDLDSTQQAIDRQAILDMIREVYNPELTNFLAVPGNKWNKQFMYPKNRPIEQALGELLPRMPQAAQGILEVDLGLYLFDVLRYKRFTDDSWTVPVPPLAPLPMGPTHPKAPKVVPWTAINANWPVSNPPVDHHHVEEMDVDINKEFEGGTEEKIEEQVEEVKEEVAEGVTERFEEENEDHSNAAALGSMVASCMPSAVPSSIASPIASPILSPVASPGLSSASSPMASLAPKSSSWTTINAGWDAINNLVARKPKRVMEVETEDESDCPATKKQAVAK